MRIKDIFTTVGAFALTVGPAFADVAKPVARAVAPLDQHSNLGSSSSLLIIALVIALGVGIYFITKNDNKSNSP